MLVAKESSFTLVLLMNISAPLLGAANSCLYSCSPQMRHQVHPKCIKVRIICYFYLNFNFLENGETRSWGCSGGVLWVYYLLMSRFVTKCHCDK